MRVPRLQDPTRRARYPPGFRGHGLPWAFPRQPVDVRSPRQKRAQPQGFPREHVREHSRATLDRFAQNPANATIDVAKCILATGLVADGAYDQRSSANRDVTEVDGNTQLMSEGLALGVARRQLRRHRRELFDLGKRPARRHEPSSVVGHHQGRKALASRSLVKKQMQGPRRLVAARAPSFHRGPHPKERLQRGKFSTGLCVRSRLHRASRS